MNLQTSAMVVPRIYLGSTYSTFRLFLRLGDVVPKVF